jgi:hypothetical protein
MANPDNAAYSKAEVATAATVVGGYSQPRAELCQGQCKSGICSVRHIKSGCCYLPRTGGPTTPKSDKDDDEEASTSTRHKKHRKYSYPDDDETKRWYCWI